MCGFYFFTDVEVLVFSGQTIDVTVCENAQLIFPLSLLEMKIELSIKYDMFK